MGSLSDLLWVTSVCNSIRSQTTNSLNPFWATGGELRSNRATCFLNGNLLGQKNERFDANLRMTTSKRSKLPKSFFRRVIVRTCVPLFVRSKTTSTLTSHTGTLTSTASTSSTSTTIQASRKNFPVVFQILNISVFEAVSDVECVNFRYSDMSQHNFSIADQTLPKSVCTFVFLLPPHVSISTPYLSMACTHACGIGRASVHHGNVWRLHAHLF